MLNKEYTLSSDPQDKWSAVIAALAVGGAIGKVYAWSALKLPLTSLPGISPDQEWSQTELAWCFSLAIFVLGASAAFFGKWVEVSGPRKTMVICGVFWLTGWLGSALSVDFHTILGLYLCYGVIGGIALGLGYISHISTLVRWFARKPGLATGLAICGFGGGGSIGSAETVQLLARFPMEQTMMIIGAIDFLVIMAAAFTIRVPDPHVDIRGVIRCRNHVSVDKAIKTQQFWLLSGALFCNVTAGIGLLEDASPMIQECVLIPQGYSTEAAASMAGGFVGLLSLANLAGRFLWASLSDRIGRSNTYSLFFILGAICCVLLSKFTVLFAVIVISMYGGGFATIPAYIRDLYGSGEVGAIHGRVLFWGWGIPGLVGPMLVNYCRDAAIRAGYVGWDRYTQVFWILSGLLLMGAACNWLVHEVERKHFVHALVVE
jgi:MFS family permease